MDKLPPIPTPVAQRWREFRSLPPEKRAELRRQLQRVMESDPAERRQLLVNMRQWERMTPEQREEMRQRFRERRQERREDRQERRQEKRERRQERRNERGG